MGYGGAGRWYGGVGRSSLYKIKRKQMMGPGTDKLSTGLETKGGPNQKKVQGILLFKSVFI